jgi:hypothetical protein
LAVTKSINTRIQESFGEAEHEDVSQYLEWVSARIASQAQSARRIVALIILLIAIFELTNEYPNTQLTFGSFHLYKGSVLIVFLPAFAAFLYLQSVIESARLNDGQRVYAKVFKKWSEKAAENQLEKYVMPTMPIYWNIGAYLRDPAKSFALRLERAVTAIFLSFIMYGVLAFEAQAYYDLFQLPNRNTILWVLSVSAATFCCLTAIALQFGNSYNYVRTGDFTIGRPRSAEGVEVEDSD